MKAWICDTDYSEGSSIVFADTRNEAKKLAQSTQACEDAEWIDIRCVRCKEIDGMEDCEPKDNPWLNNDIKLILVKERDWACIEPIGENCDKCCAKQYCHYFD